MLPRIMPVPSGGSIGDLQLSTNGVWAVKSLRGAAVMTGQHELFEAGFASAVRTARPIKP